MSPKQLVYQDLFERALVHIRNATTQSWFRRLRDRSSYHEAELIHNLYVSMFDPEFTDHDVWFLNHQAKIYCERCSKEISYIYPSQVESIKKLFSLLPKQHEAKLKWPGPQ